MNWLVSYLCIMQAAFSFVDWIQENKLLFAKKYVGLIHVSGGRWCTTCILDHQVLLRDYCTMWHMYWQCSSGMLIERCCILQIFAWLYHRSVLELGSGVGYAGIALCRMCQPTSCCLTDCHHDVLETLTENVAINLTGKLYCSCIGSTVIIAQIIALIDCNHVKVLY